MQITSNRFVTAFSQEDNADWDPTPGDDGYVEDNAMPNFVAQGQEGGGQFVFNPSDGRAAEERQKTNHPTHSDGPKKDDNGPINVPDMFKA
jgi:hypothetical protein